MLRVCVILLAGGLLLGCAGSRKTPGGQRNAQAGRGPEPTNSANVLITPGGVLPGKVLLVNTNGRFAVLSFPLGTQPAVDQRLSVYRQGLKVGEVRITGPQRDQNTVADITAGECAVGDEIRVE